MTPKTSQGYDPSLVSDQWFQGNFVTRFGRFDEVLKDSGAAGGIVIFDMSRRACQWPVYLPVAQRAGSSVCPASMLIVEAGAHRAGRRPRAQARPRNAGPRSGQNSRHGNLVSVRRVLPGPALRQRKRRSDSARHALGGSQSDPGKRCTFVDARPSSIILPSCRSEKRETQPVPAVRSATLHAGAAYSARGMKQHPRDR